MFPYVLERVDRSPARSAQVPPDVALRISAPPRLSRHSPAPRPSPATAPPLELAVPHSELAIYHSTRALHSVLLLIRHKFRLRIHWQCLILSFQAKTCRTASRGPGYGAEGEEVRAWCSDRHARHRLPLTWRSIQRLPSAILTAPAPRPSPATAPPLELAVPHSDPAISPSTDAFRSALFVNM